jgi:hypothetical protein
MMVDFQWTTQHYNPADGTLHNHYCENLKSCIFSVILKTKTKQFKE